MRQLNLVTLIAQPLEHVKHTRKHTKTSSRTDVSFIRRETKKHDRKLDAIARRGLQRLPTSQAPRQTLAAILESDRLLSSCRDTTVNKGLSGAVDLGYRDLHACL